VFEINAIGTLHGREKEQHHTISTVSKDEDESSIVCKTIKLQSTQDNIESVGEMIQNKRIQIHVLYLILGNFLPDTFLNR